MEDRVGAFLVTGPPGLRARCNIEYVCRRWSYIVSVAPVSISTDGVELAVHTGSYKYSR